MVRAALLAFWKPDDWWLSGMWVQRNPIGHDCTRQQDRCHVVVRPQVGRCFEASELSAYLIDQCDYLQEACANLTQLVSAECFTPYTQDAASISSCAVRRVEAEDSV
jgi:hypothetical protein